MKVKFGFHKSDCIKLSFYDVLKLLVGITIGKEEAVRINLYKMPKVQAYDNNKKEFVRNRMMKLLKTILSILQNFFRWKANSTGSVKRQQKKYEMWEQQLRKLKNEKAQAKASWHAVVCGYARGDRNKLWAKYLSASKRLGAHRAREPKCPNS